MVGPRNGDANRMYNSKIFFKFFYCFL
eukprot:UN21191